MSNTAPSRAYPVVVFPLGRWCPPQETSQPHPPPLIPQVLRNIVVHIHDKYRKGRMKTEGAYSIWKKVDDDGRLGIG